MLQVDKYRHASDHLSQIDEDWAQLVKLVGPCTHQPKSGREPYEALIRAIAYQQLHSRAGDAIVSRLLNLYPEEVFPTPNQLLSTQFDDFRACGFSARKIDSIRHVAENALSGIVPSRDVANGMEDDELITRLVVLRGIGRWTVEMLLIYTLERIDIMPAEDYGVRKGYRVLKSLDTLPSRKTIEKVGQLCRPYRTIASWYLWRIP